MAINLKRLNVSLTKHGAHKVAKLVDKLPLSEVMDNVDNAELNVHIDLALTKKVLSVYKNNSPVPQFWEFAKKQGPDAINALTLLSIIFTHHELISIFSDATTDKHQGTVSRASFSNEKAFTNMSNNMLELGYSTDQQRTSFSFDFTNMFKIHGLGTLVGQMLAIKLQAAGWKKSQEPLVDTSIRLDLHKVFGLTAEQFHEWLASGTLKSVAGDLNQIDDLGFLSIDESTAASEPFTFQSGHSIRKEGSITTASRESAYTSRLLHNEIQNSLFEELKGEYGAECVGTEVPTGDGTSIDLVVKTDRFCWFYEIKTASTAKLCIRQAIPQLLEYAYWQGDTTLVDKLIIVSQNEITPEADAYLKLLRSSFNLNLYYEQHNP